MPAPIARLVFALAEPADPNPLVVAAIVGSVVWAAAVFALRGGVVGIVLGHRLHREVISLDAARGLAFMVDVFVGRVGTPDASGLDHA